MTVQCSDLNWFNWLTVIIIIFIKYNNSSNFYLLRIDVLSDSTIIDAFPDSVSVCVRKNGI